MPAAVDITSGDAKSHMALVNGFDTLVRDLKMMLDNSEKTQFCDINPVPLIARLSSYSSERREWSKYAYGNKELCFTRNLVDSGNSKYNVVC